MRIMAGATPQLVSTGSLTRTLGEIFHVADDFHPRLFVDAQKGDSAVSQFFSGSEGLILLAGFGYQHVAGKMTLRADAVPLFRLQLSWIYYVSGAHLQNMCFARTMAAFAADAAFEKRR